VRRKKDPTTISSSESLLAFRRARHALLKAEELGFPPGYDVSGLLTKKCAICGGTKRLAIDHDHKTGRIRGRLCINCNSGLGMFKDDVELLRTAVSYLVDTTYLVKLRPPA